MTADISYSEDNIEQVYMVGVLLNPDSLEPDMYALVLYYEAARNDSNRPLTYGGRVVFVRNAADAPRAFALGDTAFRKYGAPPTKVTYVYDIPRVLRLIEEEDRDEDAIIADFLNELLDFVATARWPVPKHYRALLHTLADRATFDKQFGDIFSGDVNQRAATRDAILWCVGAVAMNATLLS